MKKHMIIIFNGLDQGGRPNFDELRKRIQHLDLVLQDLTSEGRLVLLNNKASWESRAEQGDQVLDVVARVFEDNGRQYFTDDIMEKFEAEMKAKEKKGMTREQVTAGVLNNNKKVAGDFEKTLTKEDVKKRGFCVILWERQLLVWA